MILWKELWSVKIRKIALGFTLGLFFSMNMVNAAQAAEAVKGTAVVQKNLLPVVRMQLPKQNGALVAGLRGAFAGVLGNQLLVAGGNCYPGNVYSDKQAPVYSKAIYGAVINEKTKKLSWKKLGELPEEIANGATVVTKDALYLVGGENASGTKASVTKLNFKNGLLEVDTIAYMPVLAKEGGAVIIDNKLHVIGGVQNGVASNNHFSLDLAQPKGKWTVLPPCPDSPRRLPIVAAQKAETGKEQLFIWGGYTPKQGEQNVELSCEGYRFDPVQKSWKLLPSPLNKDLARIYLGSGKLLPMGEHQLVAVGGAGYKALRQSLVKPEADYYYHEPAWYAYNNKVFVYDTLKNKWEARGELSGAGVALNTGAVMGNQVFIIGGESKPGVAVNTVQRLDFK